MSSTTNIELTNEDVEKFKRFMECYDNFERLYSSGFFNIRGASGTVHFDKDGNIRKVEAPIVTIFGVIHL